MFTDGAFNVAYAYKNHMTLPSLDSARADLEKYINNNLNSGQYSCLKDLAQFEKIYANITVGPVASEVIFAEEDTIVRVNMSVVLQKAGETKEYAVFERSLPVRYKKIHEFIDSLASGASLGRIPMSIFSNGIKGYVVQDIAADTTLFAFTDPKSKFEGGDFVFLSVMTPESKKEECEG